MPETSLQEGANRHPPTMLCPDGTVVLFGEILVDVFPERSIPGGAPFNVACHLQAFGLTPLLITRIGNDALGSELLSAMNGLDTRGVQIDPLRPTGQVLVRIHDGNHRFEILPDQAYDFIDPAVACTAIGGVEPDLLYFGTLAQRRPASRDALNSLFATLKCPRLLDINLRQPWYTGQTLQDSLLQSDMVKLNDEELELLATLLRLSAKDGPARAAELRERFDLKTILVTCGADGAWVLNPEGDIVRNTAGSAGAIVDTVGAGDGFAAVFILGLLQNWPPELTLARADAFARALCGIRGAIPSRMDFYDGFIEAWIANG